ncbi:MAG: M20 family metallopeptidase [Treponema sp.]|nr:M20 family metallopeptidase [Treponema sp.]
MSSFFNAVKAEEKYIIELRRHFHRYPEISLNEFNTAKKIEEELGGMGIEFKRVGETGVLGILRGEKEGKTILLRADTDALPMQQENDVPYRSVNEGVMHACGHDGHTAALLGAAKVLNSNKDKLRGEVRLVFQQAEEFGSGARKFIKAGILEGVDRVFALHLSSELDVGKIELSKGPRSASTDNFLITVKGKSAHVSAPQKGVDALYAGCQIVNALQGLVSRRVSPLDTVIVGVGKFNAGTAYNIIAEQAVMEGTIRTYKPELRDQLKSRINELCSCIAASSGASSDVLWYDDTPVLINDPIVCDEIIEVAREIAGEENIIRDHPISLGGDDFADFLELIPGAYARIGCGSPGKPRIPLHNCLFDMDEGCLVYSAAMYADVAAFYSR